MKNIIARPILVIWVASLVISGIVAGHKGIALAMIVTGGSVMAAIVFGAIVGYFKSSRNHQHHRKGGTGE